MRLCVPLLLLSLLHIEARINKCGSHLFEDCFCGQQFYEHTSMFVVNCTGLGFNNTEMLRQLPEEIEMLVFTGNHIATLPINIFGEDMDLSMLKIIDMSNNGITDIKGKTFHHVTGVERLILNHNNISISEQQDKNFHHPRVFSNFINLQELHLTNAFADNTDAALADDLHDIFVNSNLTRLIKLHLEQNEIKNFRDMRVFCDLPNLEHLYLGDNNIPNLNFNVTCLPKLVYLDLESNNITSFTERDLETFDRMTVPRRAENLEIDIDGNPFACDSAIKALYNWLHKTKVHVRNLERLECHQAKYGRKYIMGLKGMAETTHAKISLALTVILVILVVVLITLLSAYVYLKKESVKERLSPMLDVVSRKVQYTTIESQGV